MSKRYPSTLLLACLSIVLIVVAACVPPPTPAPAAATPSNVITNIVWQWTSVTHQTTKETTTVAKPQDYTITFRADGTLSGKADCNTFTGTYTQEGGFFITAIPDVMAACGGDSLDQQYLELLKDIVAGGPDGAGGLALETAGGEQRMLFKNGGPAASTAPAPSNAITNILWQWTSVTHRTTKETTEVPSPQNYTITCRDDDDTCFTGRTTEESSPAWPRPLSPRRARPTCSSLCLTTSAAGSCPASAAG